MGATVTEFVANPRHPNAVPPDTEVRNIAQERLERAQALGLVQLLAATDIQLAWRQSFEDSISVAGGFTLVDAVVDFSGRAWPGGVVSLVYAGRDVLQVGYSDPGRNQPVLVRYLPDGVVGAWERAFVSDCWDAVRLQHLAVYDAVVGAGRLSAEWAWELP